MIVQVMLDGVTLGCIYALVALGFVLVYKTTEVVNFAQGEFMTLGAFLAFTFLVPARLPVLVAIPLTLLATLAFGLLLDRVVFRRLVGEEAFAVVLVTIAVSIGLRSVMGMVWSYDTLPFPSILSREPVAVAGLATTPLQIGIVVTTVAAIAILHAFFRYTRQGVAMQATAQNQLAAYLMGVNVERMCGLVWGISCMVAAIAGILLAPIVFLNHNMGFIGLKAFPAAVLGGFGSIPGAIVGGVVLGVAENAAGVYLPAGFKEMFASVLLLVVLMVRPEGLFGIQERKKV